MAVTTLAELFLHAAGHQKPDALMQKVGGRFQPISTAELVDRVRRLARAFEKRGLAREDRVALMAENGPHWPIVDFATLCTGAALVTVYPTLRADQAAYIVHDSQSKILFVQNREQLDGLMAHRKELPGVELFVLIDAHGNDADEAGGSVVEGAEVTTLTRAHPGGRRLRRRGVRRPHPRDPAGRPGDADLHQRHHGRAQGRHADPRQHRLQHARRPVAVRHQEGVPGALLPAAGPLLRAHHRLLLLPPGLLDRLRRIGPDPGRGPGAGQAASLRLGPPGLREGPGQDPGERRAQLGGQAEDLRVGPGRRPGGPARRAPGARARAACSASSSPWRTSWSSARSRSAWAAASCSPSRAARRWPGRSASSSGAPASRSTRATA